VSTLAGLVVHGDFLLLGLISAALCAGMIAFLSIAQQRGSRIFHQERSADPLAEAATRHVNTLV